jgi:NAD(P)-dependent dehydrogenase (short-subunit alcohol dehydrogenase family)
VPASSFQLVDGARCAHHRRRGGGIGAAVAERLASDGLSVAAHFAGSPDKAKTVVEGIIATGGRAERSEPMSVVRLLLESIPPTRRVRVRWRR